MADPHRVVVIGSGFGGLFATRAMNHRGVAVTVIDRTPHHLFQPLLYQVATGILSEGEITPPTREILRLQANARVMVGEVTAIDLDARVVTSHSGEVTTTTPYDSLVVAAGSTHSYFGNPEFAQHAPGMKSIDDALQLRGRIYGAFETAELLTDPAERLPWLTFVVVGAGPTGVEMAGQLIELSRRSLDRNFRSFDPASARVVLLEAGPAVLSTFGPTLSRRTLKSLERLGVEVRLDTPVVGVDELGVVVRSASGSGTERIEARTKIWAAGVRASPLGGVLAEATDTTRNRAGQLDVLPDCSLRGHPEVFVVGDMMQMGVPAVAQVAIQSGSSSPGRSSRGSRADRARPSSATTTRAASRRSRASGRWRASGGCACPGRPRGVSGCSSTSSTSSASRTGCSSSSTGGSASSDVADWNAPPRPHPKQQRSPSVSQTPRTCERSVMSTKSTPVVFIHGLWLHASSWAPWVELFEASGYTATAPEWPGVANTVAAARANPDAIADHGIDDVVAHYSTIIESLPTAPIVVGHSFGGMIAEKLLGLDRAAAAVAVDAAQIKGVLPLPLSAHSMPRCRSSATRPTSTARCRSHPHSSTTGSATRSRRRSRTSCTSGGPFLPPAGPCSRRPPPTSPCTHPPRSTPTTTTVAHCCWSWAGRTTRCPRRSPSRRSSSTAARAQSPTSSSSRTGATP